MEVIKWVLKDFEGDSGLKIDFTKSKIILLNLSAQEHDNFVSILGFKVNSLPILHILGYNFIGRNQVLF
jgi:hypothetical protein